MYAHGRERESKYISLQENSLLEIDSPVLVACADVQIRERGGGRKRDTRRNVKACPLLNNFLMGFERDTKSCPAISPPH